MSDILHRSFNPDSPLLMGGSDGRVKIVWYLDYTDIHTRRMRDLLRRTVDRFGTPNACAEIRMMPGDARDPSASFAARAVLAAALEGRFFDLHRALFDFRGDLTEDSILEIAEGAGFDREALQAAIGSPEVDALLAEHQAMALQDAVPGTPHVYVDGHAYTGAWDELAFIEAVERPLGVRIRIASTEFFEWAAAAGLVLVLATLAALVVANIGFHDAYEHFRETHFGLSFGQAMFDLPLEAWINDGLMAVFFLLVGIEIKREIVDGELSDLSSAALPILGAIGGMLAPALIYVAINWGTETAYGWGVPMATDIAFTLGLMALLGSRVPNSLKIFVSALAIADDLGAIIVIALFYSDGIHFDALMISAGIFALMMVLNRVRVYSLTVYVLLGCVLWVFVHESGLHATLAGVLTAIAIPSRRESSVADVAAQTAAVLDQEMRTSGNTARIGERAMGILEEAVTRLREPGEHLRHMLENWSNYFILPLFAFFNTGILIIGSHFGLFAPEVLGVILGLMIGKPLGIVLICWLAVRFGLAKLSNEISWGQMLGAGCLAGVGFTMSIFIGTAAFEGEQLESVKLAILIASTLSAAMGMALLATSSRRA